MIQLIAHFNLLKIIRIMLSITAEPVTPIVSSPYVKIPSSQLTTPSPSALNILLSGYHHSSNHNCRRGYHCQSPLLTPIIGQTENKLNTSTQNDDNNQTYSYWDIINKIHVFIFLWRNLYEIINFVYKNGWCFWKEFYWIDNPIYLKQ